MKSLRLRTFGKANLSLNITGAEGGLHTLDSVMISVDVFDTVTVTERGDGDINVRFMGADIGSENTAAKAAHEVKNALDCNGWDIAIEKGIPLAAGLGGSSADGAAVLRALDIFYRLPQHGISMRKLALSVGSDVPFMLTGGTARVKAKGDDLYFIKNKLPLFAVMLMDGGVSTRECYKTFDNIAAKGELTDNDLLCERLMSGDGNALKLFSNALLEPAARLCPKIAGLASVLEGAGAKANLTGSGGAVLGWYTDIEKFSAGVNKLRGEKGFKVLAPVETGILHEWIERE